MKNPFEEINKNPSLLLYSMNNDWDLRYNPNNQTFYYKITNPNEEIKFKNYVKEQLKTLDVPSSVSESKKDAVDAFNFIISGYKIEDQNLESFFKYKATDENLKKLNEKSADIYNMPKNHNLFTKDTLTVIGPKLFENLKEESDEELSKIYFKWFYEMLIKKEG